MDCPLRSLIGGTILLLYAIVTGCRTGPPEAWVVAGVSGIFFFLGCQGVLAYVQQHVSSGLAAVLLATIPFWIAGITALLPGKGRPSGRTLMLLAPGLAGVGLIACREVVTTGSAGPRMVDIALLLGASASWAVGTVLSNRQSSAISAIVFCGNRTDRWRSGAHSYARYSLSSFAALAYLTIAGTVIAFLAYSWLLTEVPLTIVATYTFVNPVIAVLLGWAFLGEQPTVWMLAGAILIMTSVGSLLMANITTEGDNGRGSLKPGSRR